MGHPGSHPAVAERLLEPRLPDLLTPGERSELVGRFGEVYRAVREAGFSEMYFGRSNPETGDSFTPYLQFTAWDPEWKSIYLASDFAHVDAAPSTGHRQVRPFLLDSPRRIDSAAQAGFYTLARRHGRLTGFAIGFHLPGGAVTGMSFSGYCGRVPLEVMERLPGVVFPLHLMVERHLKTLSGMRVRVNEREKLFLRLLADGLTHRAIAERQAISEDWAHKTCARLRDKFQVETDAALISRAIRLGYLD